MIKRAPKDKQRAVIVVGSLTLGLAAPISAETEWVANDDGDVPAGENGEQTLEYKMSYGAPDVEIVSIASNSLGSYIAWAGATGNDANPDGSSPMNSAEAFLWFYQALRDRTDQMPIAQLQGSQLQIVHGDGTTNALSGWNGKIQIGVRVGDQDLDVKGVSVIRNDIEQGMSNSFSTSSTLGLSEGSFSFGLEIGGFHFTPVLAGEKSSSEGHRVAISTVSTVSEEGDLNIQVNGLDLGAVYVLGAYDDGRGKPNNTYRITPDGADQHRGVYGNTTHALVPGPYSVDLTYSNADVDVCSNNGRPPDFLNKRYQLDSLTCHRPVTYTDDDGSVHARFTIEADSVLTLRHLF